MTTPTSFDVCGPLPSGTTVLEASAGTGKTFTIAALATRYVAEGVVALPDMLLVTFGRAATQELRDRVRQTLVTTERALRDPAAARASDDAVLQLLSDVPDDEVETRRARLTTALADFDAATIATTHGFCQQMLSGLGLAGDLDPDADFVESLDDLRAEVVDDLYLRKYGTPTAAEPALSHGQAQSLAKAVVADGQSTLVPDAADRGSTASARFGLATAVRAELEARKRQLQIKNYDDLLTRLCDALTDPGRGAAAQQRVRSRYRLVMVDEFQDTDPVQWTILRTAFHGHTTLVLIGDPKQAIYAFRGGDVVTYLAATEAADTHSTLGRNWRSDSRLVNAVQTVFSGAALGDERITVLPVKAEHTDQRLEGAPDDAPLRVRVVRRSDVGCPEDRTPQVGVVRTRVEEDLAADVVNLLSSRARLHVGPQGDDPRPVGPGDVAVLVSKNKQAESVRQVLAAAGVPAVLAGGTNVFGTEIASEWLVLLQALEQPHRTRRLRTAALGCFIGWTAQQLAAAVDAGNDGDGAVDRRSAGALDGLGLRLREWAAVLARRGVPALLELATADGLPERLLSLPDGERRMTDLRHIAESLHAAAVAEQLGTSALVQWLERRIAEAAADEESEERSRRLDSDAAAVQVLTTWRSKGLEFPVVYLPYAWDRYPMTPDCPRFHANDGIRSLDVGGKDHPDFAVHLAAHHREQSGEDLRLLYVALTRAQCQVVTWWAPSLQNTSASALHRLLFGAGDVGREPADEVEVPGDYSAERVLTGLSERSGGTVSVQPVSTQRQTRWTPPTPAPAPLSTATFTRRLDGSWRRTSYSALTAAAHDAAQAAPASAAGVSSEAGERQLEDEPSTMAEPEPFDTGGPSTVVDDADAALQAVGSPMADLPAGAAFGIAVHSVLEVTDTTAPDLAAELAQRCHEVLGRRLTQSLDPDALAMALLPSLQTPLGTLAGGLRLSDVSPRDRLAELDFELPLAGGDDAAASAATLRRGLPPGDPFAAYADRIETLDDQQLRGYLVGSLDLVFRLTTDAGQPRYLVADYKTNWLGGASAETLSAWQYRPDALSEAMLDAHYPLQALLYLVALHRYLRWRQPGYDADVHLGGALYLFLRGMSGPENPMVDGLPCGVFGWAPPAGLVDELSRLLAGEQA
jgi:exodeoxyribonuclease V beta subunit